MKMGYRNVKSMAGGWRANVATMSDREDTFSGMATEMGKVVLLVVGPIVVFLILFAVFELAALMWGCRNTVC